MLVLFLSSPPLALPAAGPAQLADSPAAPRLLRPLSSTRSGLARLFSHLLRRPLLMLPSGARTPPASRPASGWALAAAREAAGSGRLSLLLGSALTLPGRPPGRCLPREELASARQRSSTLVSTAACIPPQPRPHPTLASPAPSSPSPALSSKRRWDDRDRAEHLQGKGAGNTPDTPFPQETLEATLSWAISSQNPWKREEALVLPEAASQTLSTCRSPPTRFQPPRDAPPPPACSPTPLPSRLLRAEEAERK